MAVVLNERGNSNRRDWAHCPGSASACRIACISQGIRSGSLQPAQNRGDSCCGIQSFGIEDLAW